MTTPSTATAHQSAPDRLRDLHPGWFASVMGTGILAVTTHNNPGGLAATESIAHGGAALLAVLAYLFAGVLVVAYASRWARHTHIALAEFRHPVKGAMHATLPGGLLVLAVMTAVVGPGFVGDGVTAALVAVLGAVGGVLALVMAVAFGMSLFAGEPQAPMINGGWFIPPVVTIIIPMTLTPLVPHVSDDVAGLLIAAGYAFYGMGFMLYLLTVGIVYDRLILHPLPPAPLAPSLWIGLGPVGVGAVAPLILARAGTSLWGESAAAVETVTRVASTALWGFGLWWLAVAVALLLRYRRAGVMTFNLGWWAFVFPLGAYTLATLTIGRAWGSATIEAIGVLLWLGLLGAWAVVVGRSVGAMRSGQIWRAA